MPKLFGQKLPTLSTVASFAHKDGRRRKKRSKIDDSASATPVAATPEEFQSAPPSETGADVGEDESRDMMLDAMLDAIEEPSPAASNASTNESSPPRRQMQLLVLPPPPSAIPDFEPKEDSSRSMSEEEPPAKVSVCSPTWLRTKRPSSEGHQDVPPFAEAQQSPREAEPQEEAALAIGTGARAPPSSPRVAE